LLFQSYIVAAIMTQTILMCPPDHFGVTYVINPWMNGQVANTNGALAHWQWDNLRRAVEQHAKLVLRPAIEDLPDLVFTANSGVVLGKKAIVSRFRRIERRGEEEHHRSWFMKNGFEVLAWPQDVSFEGAGDVLLDRGRGLLWVGHGFRTSATAKALLEKILDRETVAIRLIDPRFYHLDTCFCPLTNGYLMYFPAAFDDESRILIEWLVPKNRLIEVDEADALSFCCNAVDLNRHILMNYASGNLKGRLRSVGFTPTITPLSEFVKSGGAAKCLTLKLHEK
jgi:arginine dihydrolase